MKLPKEWLIAAVTKDDLLDRVSYTLLSLMFSSLGLMVLIGDFPNQLTLHAVLVGWVSLTMLAIAGFFVYLSCKKGYVRKIMDARGVHVFFIVFPAMLITVMLRLFDVTGRKYLENTKDLS